ncbi:25180_t:CDS:1, partial [Racocetra persica]
NLNGSTTNFTFFSMAEPKKNKTKQTNLYISRLKGVTSLVNPDYTPNIKIDNNQGWQQ